MASERLLSLCAASVVAVILKHCQGRETNAVFGLKNGGKTEHRLGILYSEDRTQKL